MNEYFIKGSFHEKRKTYSINETNGYIHRYGIIKGKQESEQRKMALFLLLVNVFQTINKIKSIYDMNE